MISAFLFSARSVDDSLYSFSTISKFSFDESSPSILLYASLVPSHIP